jgi:hypothetical protein
MARTGGRAPPIAARAAASSLALERIVIRPTHLPRRPKILIAECAALSAHHHPRVRSLAAFGRRPLPTWHDRSRPASAQNRTRTAVAIRFHFGEGARTNSAASETFDFMEFEMKHCASTPSMIARARSSSALSLRATRGRTITSVMRYLPSIFNGVWRSAVLSDHIVRRL